MKLYLSGAILLCVHFIYTLHYAIGSYINSSFVETFAGAQYVGIIFAIAAFFALIGLSQIERLLVRYGNFYLAIGILSLDILALIGMALSELYQMLLPSFFPIAFFIVHYATAVFLLKFSLDVYYEEKTLGEAVGMSRGKLLSASNVAWLLSPLIFGQLLTDGRFWRVYFLATILAVILLVAIIVQFRHLPEPRYQKIYLRGTLLEAWKNKDVFTIFLASFILNIFFSWMIIYLPIHLHDTIGFSWEQIGFMFFLMLLPYILVDMPLGYISDKFFGEKELLRVGFLITFIFTFPIALITTANFLLWTVILIGSRFGAATIEVMTDVYFFKKIDAKDANLISFYRNAPPLAYIIGPLVGSALVFTGWVSPGWLFLILSGIVFMGIFVIIPMKDTN